MEIVGLVVSPEHRYEGRPADGPKPATTQESRERIELRAPLGITGDRSSGPNPRHAGVPLISADEVDAALATVGVEVPDVSKARRNIILRNVDVEAMVNTTFTLDSGAGPVRFRSLTRANPCAWMDEVFGAGARDALRGHAGIRAEPLSDGLLELGVVAVGDIVPIDSDQRAALRSRASSP